MTPTTTKTIKKTSTWAAVLLAVCTMVVGAYQGQQEGAAVMATRIDANAAAITEMQQTVARLHAGQAKIEGMLTILLDMVQGKVKPQ